MGSSDNQFKPGDLVQLKSGGPKMTIDARAFNKRDWVCVWFSGAKHNSANFAPETLQSFIETEQKK